MKNLQQTIDVISEAYKDRNYLLRSKSAIARIRFAAEVNKIRKEKNLNQRDLAKIALTTQRVISNIESGDVNIGMDLFVRVLESLQFTNSNLSYVFDKQPVFAFKNINTSKTDYTEWSNYNNKHAANNHYTANNTVNFVLAYSNPTSHECLNFN